jgi:radical SAM superfamily enzyme YgiQ (UPF0313 family)
MNKATVLFVYVDLQASTSFSMGLGISSLSGYLKKHGRNTALVYYKRVSDDARLAEKIRQAQPNILAFYSTSVSVDVVKRLSAQLRSEFPSLYQAYGGIHATLVPETLNETGTLDALCTGYGELPLLELCRRIEEGRTPVDVPGLRVRTRRGEGEEVVVNSPWVPPADVDEYVTFDPLLFLNEFRGRPGFQEANCRLEIIFNRVCPFGCAFCSNERLRKVLGRGGFRPSPEHSVTVLRQALDETGLKFVAIHDDILTLDKAWFREFMCLFMERIGLPFSCNLRAGTFDEEDVALLKKAKVAETWIGLESGNDYIRNKIMRKGVSRKQLSHSFDLLRKHGVFAITQNLIGVPEETPAAFIETVKLNAALKPGHSFLSVFYPYPTTSLFERCRRDGLIAPHDQDFVERNETTLHMPQFPPEDIRFYSENFYRLQEYHRKWLEAPAAALPELTAENSRLIVERMLGENG